LIVDDDPAFIEQLSPALAGAGYAVLRAHNGQEAIALLERLREDIHLVIVDLILPELSGYELVGAITRRPTLMKILATTGVLKDMYLDLAQHMGAHAVLRKPAKGTEFPVDLWLRTIKTVLEAEADLKATAGNPAS
jgi:CheY-like chemotaxis protein